jgi:hypothetical protein
MILQQSCFNDFDKMKAKGLVYLSKEDIMLYIEVVGTEFCDGVN